jgi:hypothetical protein
LLDVFVGGAPESEASSESSDGDRRFDFGGYAKDAVFHSQKAHAFGEGHADGLGGQRLDFALEGLGELRIQARAAGQLTRMCQGDVFELDG